MSSTIRQLTYWNLLSGFLLSGIVWNLIFIFSIYYWMASCQGVLLFDSSMASASLIILSSLSPNLWVLSRYQALHNLTMEITLSLFFRTWWTSQLNAGSCWMSCTVSYLAIWIGCNSFRLDNFSHDAEHFFYFQQMSQPAVDFLRVFCSLTTIFRSFAMRAEPFFLWSINSFSKWYSLQLTSHWAFIDSAKKLDARSVISPPRNSTS